MPRPLQIMLVDDSPFDRGMVRRELRQAFHEVDILEVMDEHQLRAALDAATFDAVITDFQIRWTDGLRVLRSVKERLPECPVIMFTATGSEEIAVEAMKSGLDDYVIKNAQHMVRLRTAIQSAVKHRQTRIRVDQLQSRLESLLSHLRVGVFRRKPDGTIVEANDAAAAILGHSSSDELIGRKLEHYLDQSSRPVQSGLGTEDSVASATRIDGKSIWFAVSENVATGDDGEVLLEGLLEDVSDRKEAEAELLRLQDEMAHVSRISVMAEMAAGISHELHQPLNVMCTYAAVSRQKIQTLQDAPPELMEWLQQIHDLAYESAQVIRGLLEFTLKRPREPRPTLIGELIRDTLKMVQFDIRKAQVSLDLQLVDPDISVVLDPVQIRQVLLNLIRNAIEAMSATPVDDRRLSVSTGINDGLVEVNVSDRGPGFTPDQMNKLFEPFVTSKPQGTGIGLLISSRIVAAHHGALDVMNNKVTGATVRVTLPVSGQ